ncbi:MAG: hypothetical protein WAU12_15355, partial [Saprospiraceae bacterium]
MKLCIINLPFATLIANKGEPSNDRSKGFLHLMHELSIDYAFLALMLITIPILSLMILSLTVLI